MVEWHQPAELSLAIMALPISSRHLRASRSLRVLALLAWILLALSPIVGSAGLARAMGMSPASSHGMQGMAAHAAQHDGCCGSTSLHASCQCVSMCGAALLPAATVLPGRAALPAGYAMLRAIDAPGVEPNPPLRPPAA